MDGDGDDGDDDDDDEHGDGAAEDNHARSSALGPALEGGARGARGSCISKASRSDCSSEIRRAMTPIRCCIATTDSGGGVRPRGIISHGMSTKASRGYPLRRHGLLSEILLPPY